jgi:hypothetical protein
MRIVLPLALTVAVNASLAGCDPPSPAPPVVSVDRMISRLPASDQTRAATGVVWWEVYQSSSAGLAVVASDGDGRRSGALEVARTGDGALTIAGDGGRLALDRAGAVLDDDLTPAARDLLARLSVDLAAQPAFHSALTCAVSLLSVIASSAACGAAPGFGCLGLPGAFCAASRECGNNICGS